MNDTQINRANKPPIKKPTVVTPNFCECGDHAWAILTRGYIVIVSSRDAAVLKHKWHAHNSCGYIYAFRTINIVGTTARISEYLHRVLCPDVSVVDHKNKNTLDNRRHNLREATKSTNGANSKKRTKNISSSYKGVARHRRKWNSLITHKGTLYRLGSFDCEIDAALAYDRAAKKLFGEFATVNFGDRAEPWMEVDAHGCYALAIKIIGERVKNGAPVPDFMISERGRD